jgi:succinate-semialdehyde dehydrogenase/glutarate-semialdehyde dehydrogenase
MAVKGAIASKYRNAGQTCVCANRILVQDGVYDAFTKRLAETAGAMKVADGFEPGAVIGPLIDMRAVEKVEARIADAVKKAGNDTECGLASWSELAIIPLERDIQQ